MTVLKIFQRSIGLLFLSHVFLGHASLGLDTCVEITPKLTITKFGERAAVRCPLNTQDVTWTFCARGGGPYTIATNCNLAPLAANTHRLDKSGNGCHLVINNVTANNLGSYTCQDSALTDRGFTVQLGNTNENLALLKPTVQSTTAFEGISSRAVDGNTDGNWDHKSCSHTESAAGSWWAVDLGQERSIGRVRIANRNSSPERLQRFYIALTNVSPFVTAPRLDNNQSSICKFYPGYVPKEYPLDIFCEPNTLSGRYLFVYTTQGDYLTICELEAYYN